MNIADEIGDPVALVERMVRLGVAKRGPAVTIDQAYNAAEYSNRVLRNTRRTLGARVAAKDTYRHAPPTVKIVAGIVAREMGLQVSELFARLRTPEISFARSVAIVACCQSSGFENHQAIAECFGLKRSSVSYAGKAIKARASKDQSFRLRFDRIKTACSAALQKREGK